MKPEYLSLAFRILEVIENPIAATTIIVSAIAAVAISVLAFAFAMFWFTK